MKNRNQHSIISLSSSLPRGERGQFMHIEGFPCEPNKCSGDMEV